MIQTTLLTRTPHETRQAAEDFIRSALPTFHARQALHPGAAQAITLALHGELGSGKTCFVQGLAQGLDVNRPVTSPTFTLVNEYPGTIPLYHMDLYRIAHPGELFALSLEEYFESRSIVAIEWAERAANLLPKDCIHVKFETTAIASERKISILLP